MDLSKLPKLSETAKHAMPATPQPDAVPETTTPVRPQTVSYRQPGLGVDIWISLIIGILLLMMGKSFGSWAVAKLNHQPFHTGFNWPDEPPYNGREEEYFELTGYTALSDMSIFFFGVILLAEAAAKTLLILKPGFISRFFLVCSIVLTLAAVALNVYACAKLYSAGTIPTLSALAVAFGGWILFDEWTTLKTCSVERP